MQYKTLPVDSLKPHPQNTYYFDDMSGEKWNEFLESVKINGIKEPIVISQDNTIVSGHQRIRAAKELNINEVNVIQYDYPTEDDVLLDLIELNIKQRGVMADSETKAGRRFKTLKRIYGIKSGNNQYSREAQLEPSSKTPAQIAKENGISKQTMNRTIQVADSDPVLQQWNIDGKISGDTIRYIMSKLSQEERDDFYSNNEEVEKIRKKDVVEYEKLKAENSRLKSSLVKKEEEIEYLLNETDNQDISDEDVSSDIEQKYEELRSLYNKEVSDYKSQIDTMKIELDTLRRSSSQVVSNYKDGDEIFNFCSECNQFVSKIVSLQYSDAFRKISAERTLPLNTLADSCGKVMDALEELIKHIKTDSVVDVIDVDVVDIN